MTNQQLLDFIKLQLQKGSNKEIISKELLANGWNLQDIEEGFKNIAPVSNVPMPSYSSPLKKKSHWKLASIVVVILFALGGGIYYFLQNKNLSLSTETVKSVDDSVLNSGESKVYTSTKGGYSINYPLNWYSENSGSIKQEVIAIANNNNVLLEGVFGAESNYSLINVYVTYGKSYPSIDDYIKDSKNRLPQSQLSNVSSMDIGGKNLRVLTTTSSPEGTALGYDFIYNDNLYSLNFVTANSEQFSIDYPVFYNIVSSFNLLQK
ncbi:MAG TPA: PsbP-related protein [Candidatus Paceibacterota bacterium]|nr:PsbP-related protein [Candidatus Paceibacterota bacterium]